MRTLKFSWCYLLNVDYRYDDRKRSASETASQENCNYENLSVMLCIGKNRNTGKDTTWGEDLQNEIGVN